jgi:hypothetical protein
MLVLKRTVWNLFGPKDVTFVVYMIEVVGVGVFILVVVGIVVVVFWCSCCLHFCLVAPRPFWTQGCFFCCSHDCCCCFCPCWWWYSGGGVLLVCSHCIQFLFCCSGCFFSSSPANHNLSQLPLSSSCWSYYQRLSVLPFTKTISGMSENCTFINSTHPRFFVNDW